MIAALLEGSAAEVMAGIVLGLSGAVVGLSAYLGIRNIVDGIRTGRSSYIGYASLRVGTAGVVGLVAQAIFGYPVPITWKAVCYAVSLALIGVGALIVITTGAYRRH